MDDPATDLLLHRAGLILDLRSDSERNENLAQEWMAMHNFTVQKDRLELSSSSSSTSPERIVLRLDVLDADKCMAFLEQNWLTPSEQRQAFFYKLVDGNKLHKLRMDCFNRQGVLGLNQAILETGKPHLFSALQAMVLYWEQQQQRAAPVVVHCVKGKDRTGMLVMLCQSILGYTKQEMIDEYHLSDEAHNPQQDTTKKTKNKTKKSLIDRNIFNTAPKHVMKETIEWLECNHGGSIDGYLDDIGFDETWRQRFRKCAVSSNSKL